MVTVWDRQITPRWIAAARMMRSWSNVNISKEKMHNAMTATSVPITSADAIAEKFPTIFFSAVLPTKCRQFASKELDRHYEASRTLNC
jgi:hypothetical protein